MKVSAATCPEGALGIARRQRPSAGTGFPGAVLPQHVVKLSRVQGSELCAERRPGRLEGWKTDNRDGTLIWGRSCRVTVRRGGPAGGGPIMLSSPFAFQVPASGGVDVFSSPRVNTPGAFTQTHVREITQPLKDTGESCDRYSSACVTWLRQTTGQMLCPGPPLRASLHLLCLRSSLVASLCFCHNCWLNKRRHIPLVASAAEPTRCFRAADGKIHTCAGCMLRCRSHNMTSHQSEGRGGVIHE